MLIFNSTDTSIWGCFHLADEHSKNFQHTASMWKFTFLNKSNVKTKKKKDAIETDFLFSFQLMDNFESCCFIPETCKTCILYHWTIYPFPEKQISLCISFLEVFYSCSLVTKVELSSPQWTWRTAPLKKGATLKKATDLDSVWCQLGDSTLNLHWLMINFSKHKAVWCKWHLQKKNVSSQFLAGIIPLLIPWEILHISWSGCLKIWSITLSVNNMKLPSIIFKGKRVVTRLVDLFSCIWTNVRAASARNCIDLANGKRGFLH